MKTAIITSTVAALMFVVDLASLIRDTGRQVDWSLVTGDYKRGAFAVKLAEDVSVGETSVDVVALSNPLKKGDSLDFGQIASVPVTIGASATAGAVSVTVTSLSGPIPAGAVIDLGTNKFLRTTANALKNATTLAVSAIPTALAGGETGTFKGGDQRLVLAADAAKGAVNITVESPEFFIANNSVAYGFDRAYESENRDAYFIPEGTIMVEVDPVTNRKIIPLAIHPQGTSATGAVMIALTNMKTDSKTDSLTGYGVTYGGIFNENYMPDAVKNGGTLPSGWKTFLGARYVWKIARDSRSL